MKSILGCTNIRNIKFLSLRPERYCKVYGVLVREEFAPAVREGATKIARALGYEAAKAWVSAKAGK